MAQKEYTLGATAAGNDIICEDRERGLKVERMLYLFVFNLMTPHLDLNTVLHFI